jgi:FMN phosphatase YigB (HAD superfamily)
MKAVLFDLDETLIPEDEPLALAYQAVVRGGASDLHGASSRLPGFDVVVASCDLGIGKPDAAIFEAALDALGVGASDAVMVGNDRERDVEGADAAGIRPLWIQHGRPESRADLHELVELPALLGF